MSNFYRLTADRRKVCQDCGGDDFVTVQSHGDVVCRGCGLVLEQRIIDERSEWRTFSDKDKEGEDPNRVGGPSNTMLADGGLSTTIGKLQGDGGISHSLNRYHQRQNTSDRSMQNAHKEINRLADRLNLSDAIKVEATRIYLQTHDNKALKGRGLQAIYAACVFLACRNENLPRTFKEICAVIPDVNRKDIARAFTRINELLVADEQARAAGEGKANATGPSGRQGTGPLADAASMRRFLSHMGYRSQSRFTAACVRALETAKKMAEEQTVPWSGRSPNTITSSVVALMNEVQRIKGEREELVTLQQIAECTGAAPTTIQDGYRQMVPYARQIVPESFASAAELSKLPTTLGSDGGKKAALAAPVAPSAASTAAGGGGGALRVPAPAGAVGPGVAAAIGAFRMHTQAGAPMVLTAPATAAPAALGASTGRAGSPIIILD